MATNDRTEDQYATDVPLNSTIPTPMHTGLSNLPPDVVVQLLQELDADLVRTKPKAGTDVPFLEHVEIIRAANDIFGFGGWGTQVTVVPEMHEVFALDHQTGERRYLGCYYMARVRVTVRGCEPYEDVGICVPRKEMTFESHLEAVKGCISDGEKRCLRHYGSRFGLDLRDVEMRDAIMRTKRHSGGGTKTAQPVRQSKPSESHQQATDVEAAGGKADLTDSGLVTMRQRVIDLGKTHRNWDQETTQMEASRVLGKPWAEATTADLSKVANDILTAARKQKQPKE